MSIPRSVNSADYQMQPRIKLRRDDALVSSDASVKLLARGDEKPYSTSSMSVPIALGVTIPIVFLAGVLFFLWRRNIRRQALEDAKDPHSHLDFGLDEAQVGPKKKGRRSMLMGGEKASHKINQLSMDMNLSSPYLLPPQAQGSLESVHTMTRGYPAEFDPYRIVNSEVGSIRSFNKETSVSGSANKRDSTLTGRSMGTIRPQLQTRQDSFPRSPISPADKIIDPFANPTPPERAHQLPSTAQLQEPIHPVKPVYPEIGTVHYPEDKANIDSAHTSRIQEPPAAMSKSTEQRLGSTASDFAQFQLPGVAQSDNTIGLAYPGDDDSSSRQYESIGLGLNLDLPKPMSPIDDFRFLDRHDAEAPQALAMSRQSNDSSNYQDYEPQTQISEYYDSSEYFDRGRPAQRQASLELNQPQGLGVPQQDNKRLSVGFRPLPPDEVTESEDPEYRANRIRSFYKEYFDDSAPPPPMPNKAPARAGGGGGGGSQYHEDYDEKYLGEAAYFDPDTNAFVMPYAQPVTRRAMTPPPAGRRGPPGPGSRGGPRGDRPHGPNGSLGGMSLQGVPQQQRSRAGSAWGDSRAPSSFGPRPDSSASTRSRQAARKNLPPPSALSTLPTPSKLKDDSFALLNAADFAPPESFAGRARGRSQSPLGERRPYSPMVPAASPLIAADDELAVLPSPHLLRKSSTFTGLDFLPPKKFKDSSDNQSDAGSIRSNRSGISSNAASAIRAGAGRVSRLPSDQVFTQHAMENELKPQWGFRK